MNPWMIGAIAVGVYLLAKRKKRPEEEQIPEYPDEVDNVQTYVSANFNDDWGGIVKLCRIDFQILIETDPQTNMDFSDIRLRVCNKYNSVIRIVDIVHSTFTDGVMSATPSIKFNPQEYGMPNGWDGQTYHVYLDYMCNGVAHSDEFTFDV